LWRRRSSAAADETLGHPDFVQQLATGYSIFGLLWTESKDSSGFFIEKKPPFAALKKSTCIPKML